MAEKALTQVETKVFSGLNSGMDSHDLEPGQALVQVNVLSIRPGELIIRRGMREALFDAE